ncbi:MAG: 4-(cytidine 5'-diphospho)-2-C-methyl-D-erythritol kinase, partial [Candidatus Omnitrophica bacterium]|nr:4-(cytidine 5'-diphospho)-2-C-methyl-D-erythritol kinase [Candidatus Omnitrophota bacterium]
MREFTVYAPAKLNLYLDVIGKRPDGYHNIETLFEKIDLKDEIVIKEKNRGIDVKVEPSDLCPSGKDNIVYEAVQTLLKESGADLGLEIVIRKKIPVSAGLGGGSSNAASVMLAINKAFELGITQKRLFSMAGQIGKDVPFFMTDHSLALGTGTGDDLEKIDADIDLAHILIKPK